MKLSAGRAVTGRRLFSVPIDALGPDPRAGLARFLDALSAPRAVMAALVPYLGSAAHLHAGAEEGGSDDVCKVYLEFSKPPPREADLVFAAIKWSGSGRWIRSYYRKRRVENLANLIEMISPPETRNALNSLVHQVQEHQMTPLILEVSDEDTPRRSLDLNFYDAQIRLGDIADLLEEFFTSQGLGADDSAFFLNSNRDKMLGHIAVGRGRDNQVFATIHYGAEACT